MYRRRIPGRAFGAGLAAAVLVVSGPGAGLGRAAAAEVREPVPSGLAGAAEYADGEFVWTDFAFDDHGAATTPPLDDYENLVYPGDTAARSSRGSYQYPDDPDLGHNGADIVQVRIRGDERAVRFTVRLNVLIRPGAAAVTVAIDASPGGPAAPLPWPHQARVRSGGADAFLTLWGTDGTYAAGGAPVPLRSVGGSVSVSTAENTIEASLPRAVLDPGQGRWRVWAAAGLWDAGAGEYRAVPAGETGTEAGLGSEPSLPRLFDVAFNTGEPTQGFQAYWNDVRQAEALAAGDLTALGADVDFGLMARGGQVRASPARGAFNVYVYRSSIDVGEGLVPEPRRSHDNFVYLSRYQPYTVYVPRRLADPAPVLYLMHFRGGNHNGYTVGSQAYTRIGEELGALIVQPHSRGEYRMCEADAEVDFHDVRAHVAGNFRTDPDRVFLAGMSMGGFCTWRLGLAHPDLFAAAIVYAGWPQAAWPTYGTVVGPAVPPPPYDMTDFAENARNLPFLVIHGTNDEILPYTDSARLVQRLEELGYEHRVQLYPGGRHDSQFPARTPASAIAWLRGRVREPNPVRVTYRTDPVSGRERASAPPPAPRRNALWLRLENVASLTVDVGRAGLRPGAPLALTVHSDTPAVLRLREPEGTREVRAATAVLGGELARTGPGGAPVSAAGLALAWLGAVGASVCRRRREEGRSRWGA